MRNEALAKNPEWSRPVRLLVVAVEECGHLMPARHIPNGQIANMDL